MKDLFEHHQDQPEALKKVCEKWQTKLEDEGLSFEECAEFQVECENLGYTFEYDLSAEPYNLVKMDTNS